MLQYGCLGDGLNAVLTLLVAFVSSQLCFLYYVHEKLQCALLELTRDKVDNTFDRIMQTGRVNVHKNLN